MPKHGIDIDNSDLRSTPVKGVKALLAAPLQILTRRQARSDRKRFKPGCRAQNGRLCFRPRQSCRMVIKIVRSSCQANGIAGLTNREWLKAKSATTVMQAFPGAFSGRVVSNPVRRRRTGVTVAAPECVWPVVTSPIRVLVVSGSQGLEVLNQTMPRNLPQTGRNAVTIWHQSAEKARSSRVKRKAYAGAGQPQHKVTEFISDMARAYAWADVAVVCAFRRNGRPGSPPPGYQRYSMPFQHRASEDAGMRCRAGCQRS